MTPDQAMGMYYEARRQEARDILNMYHAVSIAHTNDKYRSKAIEDLNMFAFPFDPEADGDFDNLSIKDLKKIVGKDA